MSGCDDCSRRALLRGLVFGAAGVAIAACRSDDGISVDAGPAVDAPPPAVTMCGGNLCIDLTNAAAVRLTAVNGTLLVTSPSDRIIVLRQSDTAFVALSDICTHAGCAVTYSTALGQMTCPCHGSHFSLSGAVTHGPAARPLTAYQTSFDMTAQILTIML
jgi:cytochrome b6-f complex iron-sulfur subunit